MDLVIILEEGEEFQETFDQNLHVLKLSSRLPEVEMF
jgi:hypothetical protein